MATIKDMSQTFLNEIYELSIFLRLNGHSTLGERIVTAAVEVATLSHISWTTSTNGEFLANLVKTHEYADKLNSLMEIVKYLELGYEGMAKVIEDTEAIFKMSRSSVNTTFTKLGLKEAKKSDAPESGYKPSKDLKTQVEKKNEERKDIAREGNDTVPEQEHTEEPVQDQDIPREIEQVDGANLPFDVDITGGTNEEPGEAVNGDCEEEVPA